MTERAVRWHARFSDFTEAAWNGLRPDGRNPFLHYAFLDGLEKSGSIRADLGWTPNHLGIWQDHELVAAAPGYLKTNSHGEFVFDHAWAHAFERYGKDYYPKQLFAVPYSPVTGPRWFAKDTEALALLLDAMRSAPGVSSVHLNFLPASDVPQVGDWLLREDLQYHWTRDPSWGTFDGYLAAMDHKHRKNIRQERQQVARAGVTFRVAEGADIAAKDLELAYEFYLQTFAEYGNYPALTFEFFVHLRATMPEAMVLIFAMKDGETLAGAVCFRSGTTLYGRYWGSHVQMPGLHFETCYYQGIDYCLREGLRHFEPGAQGVHKIARGFLPTATHSAHWIGDSGFREAIAQWCLESNREVRKHQTALMQRSPFK